MQRCNGVALEGNNELESKIFRRVPPGGQLLGHNQLKLG